MKFRTETIRALPEDRPSRSKSYVFADDEVRFGECSAFEDAVVVRIFLDDAQGFCRGDVITQGKDLDARVLERIAIPLELVARSTRIVSASIASEISTRMVPARAWPTITVAGPPKCSALRHRRWYRAWH